MQEQSSAEYIRKLKAKIAALPRKERIKRLEHERHNSPNRTVAKQLDEMLKVERGGYRRRIGLKLAGWVVILATIFYVLIAFGQPHPQRQAAQSSSRSSKVQKSSSSKKSKHKAKKQKQSSSSSSSSAATSSSSSTVAASSSSVVSSSSSVVSSSSVQSSSSSVQRQATSSSQRSQTTQQTQTTRTQQATSTSQSSTYTIQNGDNLYRIAVNHGMTLKQLQALNGMNDSSELTPGQTIRVK